MAITYPEMGLIGWNSQSDPYNNSQLSDNFQLIDQHDHSSGKGAPLTSNSISPNIIGWPAIQLGAIQGSDGPQGANIYPGSITGTEIANGTITSNLLDPAAISAFLPLGTTTAWFRPNQTIPIPDGWNLCDGSILGPSQHSFPGGGSITLPDLRNSFILGADPDNSGDGGPTVAPGEEATGGLNQQNINHTHTIPAHSHNFDHSHTTGSHAHSISLDGSHNHTFSGGTDLGALTLNYANGIQSFRFLWDPLLIVDGPAIMDAVGAHNHTGFTGGSGLLTTGSPTPIATDAVLLDTLGPDEFLPFDFRPNFVGMLYIMYVQFS